jgi:hypothetical protein
MSKIASKVQTITIPAPRYNFGDLVEWQRPYSNKSLFKFVGAVECRTWEDDPEGEGHWHYYAQIQKSECNGEPRFISGGEEMAEIELSPYTE